MKNAELMIAAGSETGNWDPTAPEHWRWQLAHGTDDDEIFLAWVFSKTCYMSKSPFCVSERGTPLTLKHAAQDLNWTEKKTQAVAARVEGQGRVRLEKGKRVWYRANVPIDETKKASKTDPLTEGSDEFVQRSWSSYVYEKYKKAPEELRKRDAANTPLLKTWAENLEADALAAVRVVIAQVEDIMTADIGAPKIRIKKRPPERARMVQMKLLAEPEFVQSYSTNPLTEFVQSAKGDRTNGQNGSNKPESATPSLLSSDTDTDSPSSSALSQVSEADQLASALEIDDDVAAQILFATRKAAPKESVEVIVELCRAKRAQVGTGARNLPGLLLHGVPKMARGAPLVAARRAVAARAKESADFAEAEATNRREWQRLYDQPDTPEKDRALLRELLGIDKSKGASS
jgi:hypothetical protein